MTEVEKREASFLSHLSTAQEDYEWLVRNEAWLALGYDSFAGWWSVRVVPVMNALSMRPTKEISALVLAQVKTEETALPPLQRRTQRELGTLMGGSRDEGRSRSARGGFPHRADLETAPTRSVQAAGKEIVRSVRKMGDLAKAARALIRERVSELEQLERSILVADLNMEINELVNIRDFVKTLVNIDDEYKNLTEGSE